MALLPVSQPACSSRHLDQYRYSGCSSKADIGALEMFVYNLKSNRIYFTNLNISFNAYNITCQLKRKLDGKSTANFVHKIVKKKRTQFSPTNSLFSTYLYLTSIIKYVIYWPLPNSINFLWVRNCGDESCWVRTSLVTNEFGYEVSSFRLNTAYHEHINLQQLN